MSHDAEYMMERIKAHLVGRRIRHAVRGPDGSFGFTLDDGTLVWVDCDAEGNGPGWLAIEKPEAQRPEAESTSEVRREMIHLSPRQMACQWWKRGTLSPVNQPDGCN